MEPEAYYTLSKCISSILDMNTRCAILQLHGQTGNIGEHGYLNVIFLYIITIVESIFTFRKVIFKMLLFG